MLKFKMFLPLLFVPSILFAQREGSQPRVSHHQPVDSVAANYPAVAEEGGNLFDRKTNSMWFSDGTQWLQYSSNGQTGVCYVADGDTFCVDLTTDLVPLFLSINGYRTLYPDTTGNFTFSSANVLKPQVTIENTNTDEFGSSLVFYKNSTTPAPNDVLGDIVFRGNVGSGALSDFGFIRSVEIDTTSLSYDGKLEFHVFANSIPNDILVLTGTTAVVDGALTTTNFQMTAGATDGYVLTSDVSGNASWNVGLGSSISTSEIDDNAVTEAKLFDFGANTILMRNAGTPGDADDIKISALTEDLSPSAGDLILGENAAGDLVKYDVGNLPSGGGAPVSAPYVVVSLDGTLTAERQIAEGSYIDLTDGGANGNLTVAFDPTELTGTNWSNSSSSSYSWVFTTNGAEDPTLTFSDGDIATNSDITFNNNLFLRFKTALDAEDGSFIGRASDNDMQLKNASDDFEFIVIDRDFQFRDDVTTVHQLSGGSGNPTYFNTPVAINKTSITAGIELDVSGDIHATGNITLGGTVDGVDIAARDHDSVTLAGSYDYLTIAGQVITRNQIDAATDITGTLPDGNIASTIHRDSETKDGDLVSFDDADANFAATNVDDAISELDNVNVSGPNAADSKVEWSQIGGMPAGFADGTDDGGGVDLSAEPFYTVSSSANLSNETVLSAGNLADLTAGVIDVDLTEAVNLTFGDGTQSSFTHTMDLASGDINWQYSANAIQLGANMSFVRSSAGNPVLTLQNENDDANPAGIVIAKNPATPNDNDGIGYIQFKNDNSAGSPATFAQIQALSSDVSSGTEDGLLYLSAMNSGVMQNLVTVSGIANKVIITDLQLGTALLPAFGGTGATSLTDGGVLFGSGTSAITASAVMGIGELLIGDNSGDPTLATLTEGSGISILNNPGSITISSTLGTAINSAEITDGTILPVDLAGTPSDEYILTYESTGATFEYQTIASLFTEGEGIDFSGTTNLTISGENASTSNKGIASFNSSHFSVASGAVSLNHQTTVTSSSVALPNWTFENTNSDATGSFLYFKKDGGSPADNDNIGNIYFTGEDSLNSAFTVAKIEVDQDDYTTGDGAGRIDFYASINNTLTNVLSLDGYTDAVGRGKAEINQGQADVDFVLNHDTGELLRAYGDDGDIGVGTTLDPQGLLHLKEAAGSDNLVLESDASSTSDNTDHGQMAWYTTVNSAGKLARILVEADGTWSGGDESASMVFSVMQNTTLNRRFEIRANGAIEDGSGGTLHAASDSTLKTNIRTIRNALDLVSAMRGVTFNWKKSGKFETGMLAQEVQKVLPSAVYRRSDGLLAIEERELFGVLVQAINELQENTTDSENKHFPYIYGLIIIQSFLILWMFFRRK